MKRLKFGDAQSIKAAEKYDQAVRIVDLATHALVIRRNKTYRRKSPRKISCLVCTSTIDSGEYIRTRKYGVHVGCVKQCEETIQQLAEVMGG